MIELVAPCTELNPTITPLISLSLSLFTNGSSTILPLFNWPVTQLPYISSICTAECQRAGPRVSVWAKDMQISDVIGD